MRSFFMHARPAAWPSTGRGQAGYSTPVSVLGFKWVM